MTVAAAWEAFVALAAREEQAQASHGDRYPHYANDDGTWHRLPLDATSGWVDDRFYDHGNWTAGFGAGVSWLRTLEPGQPAPGEGVRRLLRDLPSRAVDDTTHDVGFLFYPAYVLGRISGGLEPDGARPALTAAGTLACRFRDEGGYIQAFGSLTDPRSAGTSTIDTMMNLPLLWWAQRQDGNGGGLAEIALSHAVTSARTFFRDDDSTFHLVRFDPESGRLRHRGTFQGAASESCWSRGQAWAVAGFAWAYAATCDTELLAAAERAWRYFVARLPEHGVVPWDFSDERSQAPRDASASAIAALGALILGTAHPRAEQREEYVREGRALLVALAGSAVSDGCREGILLRSCYSQPHGLGVDGATPWGDFYYGLALALANGCTSVADLLGCGGSGLREGAGSAAD
jgi:unsaturated chondroitin disaccharide hydrolase